MQCIACSQTDKAGLPMYPITGFQSWHMPSLTCCTSVISIQADTSATCVITAVL